jgi:hypothetical protein
MFKGVLTGEAKKLSDEVEILEARVCTLETALATANEIAGPLPIGQDYPKALSARYILAKEVYDALAKIADMNCQKAAELGGDPCGKCGPCIAKPIEQRLRSQCVRAGWSDWQTRLKEAQGTIDDLLFLLKDADYHGPSCGLGDKCRCGAREVVEHARQVIGK